MATTVTTNTKEPLKSQQQQQQQQGVVSSNSSMGIVEDESLKRNTDCVYFLASPLTCKKGSECEYRHSEYARVNPRDCWYWLNGNCLNPKCSFRHPPLDGLVGPQTGNFAGPPTVVPPAPPVPVTPQNPAKQGVPCIFFQKGYCLKGDRCPFMHGPNPISAKIQSVPASTMPPEAPVFKKAFGTLEKGVQPKGIFHVKNVPKVVEAPAQAHVAPKVQSARPTNGQPVGRGYQPPSGVIEQAPKYKERKPSPVDNGNLRSRTAHAHHGGSSDDLSFQNGRDADDLLRESSPGFDVLVDDKLSDDEYYHNEDQYVGMRGHEGRDLNEFDLGHQDDYNSVADVDPETYHNRRGYDSFDRVPEKYAWDHRRASSDRSLVEPAHYDRRGSYNKSQSPDFSHNLDLRQRLSSKQRRVNGLKSVVKPDYKLDPHAEERGYRGDRGSYRGTGRDSRWSPVHETSRGQRLQGRIKLPRSSPERESERGRNWGRLSPSRNQVSGQQGHLRDRLNRRNLEESPEERRISGPVTKKDTFLANDSNFAAPKRLSELKGTKQTDDNRQHQVKTQQSVVVGKLRDTVLASSFGTDGDLSFEGPKPLSEILKRKRTGPICDTNSSTKDDANQHETDVKLKSSVSDTPKDTEKQVTSSEVVNKPVPSEADNEEGEISNKKIKLNDEGESSFLDDNKHPEVEEVAADDEEQKFDEEYDQGDGEYEYEQEDGEGYHLNELETGEHEGDSMDEDDGDDFAKTLGVSF